MRQLAPATALLLAQCRRAEPVPPAPVNPLTLLPLAQALPRLNQADAQQADSGGPVPIATLLARYERFRDDAGTARGYSGSCKPRSQASASARVAKRWK